MAAAFASQVLRHGDPDVWEAAFALGRAGRSLEENDLVPYWLFPGEAKIERHVSALPFSREVGPPQRTAPRAHDLPNGVRAEPVGGSDDVSAGRNSRKRTEPDPVRTANRSEPTAYLK